MPYCGDCKQECKVIEVDNGIGAYEFWGAPGVDIRLCLESDCCGGDVFDDPECTKPYEFEPDDDRYEQDVPPWVEDKIEEGERCAKEAKESQE